MFKNRFEAGALLAEKLQHHAGSEAQVLAIPRGGIEVGYPIASSLKRPLSVIIPRKIPCPNNPELAIGAVAFDGQIEMDEKLVREVGLSETDIQELVHSAQQEIEHRSTLYCKDSVRRELNGRPVILIDDGLATGYTMIAGIKSVRQESPSRVIVAVPVSPASTYERIRQLVDEIIVLHVSRDLLFAVSAFYDNFRDLGDEELLRLLEQCNRGSAEGIRASR